MIVLYQTHRRSIADKYGGKPCVIAGLPYGVWMANTVNEFKGIARPSDCVWQIPGREEP